VSVFSSSCGFKELLTKHNNRFGIEFAPEVVLADGSVQNLAWRICNAKKVLVSAINLGEILMILTFRCRRLIA
jgi:hypothetical protein